MRQGILPENHDTLNMSLPTHQQSMMERYLRKQKKVVPSKSFHVEPDKFGDNDETRDAILRNEVPLDPERTGGIDGNIRAVAADMLPQLVDYWESHDSPRIAEAADGYVNSQRYQDLRMELTRLKEDEGYKLEDDVKDEVAALDSATSMDLPENINLYRGMKFKGKPPIDFTPGMVFSDPSFTSTSTEERMAKSFANVIHGSLSSFVFKMTTKKGNKGAPIAMMTPDAASKTGMTGESLLHEGEILLPRDTRYRVTSVEDIDGRDNKKFITLEILNEDE